MNARTKFPLIALFMLFSFAAISQISVGLRGGINWNNVYATQGLNDLTPDFKNIEAINIAAIAEIPITEQFSFQPELGYTRKGLGVKLSKDIEVLGLNLPLGAKAEPKFGYIEIPLLAKYKFGTGPVNAYVSAGPAIGFAVNGKLENKLTALLDFDIGSVPINLDAINYKRFEVSGIIGAGVTIDAGFGQLFAEARYQRGFTGLSEIPLVDETVKTKGFGLSAGFLIPIN